MKAFEFLEDIAHDMGNEYEDVRDMVDINDAYWACKLFSIEELEKLLTQKEISIEGMYSIIEQRIKQLKSKKVKINQYDI